VLGLLFHPFRRRFPDFQIFELLTNEPLAESVTNEKRFVVANIINTCGPLPVAAASEKLLSVNALSFFLESDK
jgi:hypothetical protein